MPCHEELISTEFPDPACEGAGSSCRGAEGRIDASAMSNPRLPIAESQASQGAIVPDRHAHLAQRTADCGCRGTQSAAIVMSRGVCALTYEEMAH